MSRTTAIQALASLPYVGERLATRFYEELGIASVGELVDAALTNRLQALSGIGTRREQQILAAAQAATPTQLVDVLRCPACGHDGLEARAASVKCPSCQRQYGIDHGVVDLESLGPPRAKSVAQRIMETRFYAKFYEDVMRPRFTNVVTDRTMPEEYVLAAQYLRLDAAKSVLDVACGTGNFTRHFAHELRAGDHHPLLIGADVSWPMLETARTYLRADGLEDSVHLVRANASKLPLRSESFDRIHCAGALHFMDDVDATLAEFGRLLEPGGICVIGTFVAGRDMFKRALKRIAEIPSGFRWFGPDELPGRMASHGLAVYAESVQGNALTLAARRV